jgi:hypothetical protein
LPFLEIAKLAWLTLMCLSETRCFRRAYQCSSALLSTRPPVGDELNAHTWIVGATYR